MSGDVVIRKLERYESDGCDTGIRFLEPLPLSVPDPLRERFHPASNLLYEWETYWVQCPGADFLRVGGASVRPVIDGLFPLRFENQLGLSKLQPFRDEHPLGGAMDVEVISAKFGGAEGYYRFYKALLDELFSSASRLPFTFHAPTSRGVDKAASAPSPMFTLHFFRQYGASLRAALAAIRERPHRMLVDRSLRVPLSQASDVDADVILSILQRSEDWTRASGFPLAARMGGYAPVQVLQRQPHETLDSPENRFVVHFLREMIHVLENLRLQPWWVRVPNEQRMGVHDLGGFLREMAGAGVFHGVGPMQALPVQGLLEREGYRTLLKLWSAFTTSRQPLFGRMDGAMEVRDIATLYEIWVFFRLVEEIGSVLGLPTEGRDMSLNLGDATGLGWRAEARFGDTGTLIYNQGYDRSGGAYETYSVPLRPDFTWVVNGRPEVALDAKFRVDRPTAAASNEGDASARHADIHKMHAYRDALRVRAAVAIYPGDACQFYHRTGNVDNAIRIPQLIRSAVEGVGAISLRPLQGDGHGG